MTRPCCQYVVLGPSFVAHGHQPPGEWQAHRMQLCDRVTPKLLALPCNPSLRTDLSARYRLGGD